MLGGNCIGANKKFNFIRRECDMRLMCELNSIGHSILHPELFLAFILQCHLLKYLIVNLVM